MRVCRRLRLLSWLLHHEPFAPEAPIGLETRIETEHAAANCTRVVVAATGILSFGQKLYCMSYVYVVDRYSTLRCCYHAERDKSEKEI